LLAGSNIVANWKCQHGHTWKQRIVEVYGKDNPCEKCKSLAHNYPELLKFWDYKKNRKFDPAKIAKHSNKKVWWRCDVARDHKWQATPDSMTHRKNACQFCFGKKASSTSNLLLAAPELAKEWDYQKNDNLRPEHVTKGSKRKVWWKCSQGHSYQANVNNRSSNGAGCKLCSNQSSIPEVRLFTELSALFPDAKWRHQVDGYEIDVFLPAQQIGIEYDGFHWHQNKREGDLQKNKFFDEIGISLIRIRAAGLFQLSSNDIVTRSHELELQDLKALLIRMAIEKDELKNIASDYQKRKSFLADTELKE